MNELNTNDLKQYIETLESSLERLNQAKTDSIDFEVFRNATIKGFELTLEITGKLLRKVLKNYSGNPREIDVLTYKDVFRHAGKHGLLDSEAIQRWFTYRDNRNDTAHDYGVSFAKTTLKLLPNFLHDAKSLQKVLANQESKNA